MVNMLIRIILVVTGILIVSPFIESRIITYGLGIAIAVFIFQPLVSKIIKRDLSK
ncbi:hypothetical protein BRE01_37930 [Brevibacillus reuszeri]|uniref:Uncharacterized protein n=1 Tax=Brevibacillus reuszeri TaxID=54915 RepID=A0ABQ0TQF5_9BACL|nr:hypothetical protein BRE01_37930 [Brevibacillus reuszeri]